MRAMIINSARARFEDLGAVFAIRDFAIYQIGNFLSSVGFWMQRIAIGWVVWELTRSEAWLGLVAFAELFPSIFTGFYGGILADRISTIQIMKWGQIGICLVSAFLAISHALGVLDPNGILFLMVLLGALSGLILPSRLAMASFLSPSELLPSALAVNSTSFNLSRFAGPAIAASILIFGGPYWVFAIASLTYLSFVLCLHLIRHAKSQAPTSRPDASPQGMFAGLAGLTAMPLVLGAILIQLLQGVLMRPAAELFPAFAETVFSMGAAGLGMLNTALGIGAIIGALALSRSRNTRSALAQIFGGTLIFGVSLLAFVTTGSFILALLILVVQGAAMSSSNIAAMAFVQLRTPRERLGRVLAVYAIVFRVGPAIGAFIFGLAAEAFSLSSAGLLFGLIGLVTTVMVAVYLLLSGEEW